MSPLLFTIFNSLPLQQSLAPQKKNIRQKEDECQNSPSMLYFLTSKFELREKYENSSQTQTSQNLITSWIDRNTPSYQVSSISGQ